MKIQWYGHSCFAISYANGVTIVIDPFDETVGYPLCRARADAVLTSHDHFDHAHVQSLAGNPEIIKGAGARTCKGLKILGIKSFHDDCRGAVRGENTIFRIDGDGLSVAHLGDLGHMLAQEQLCALQNLDCLLVPIGGTFTIDTAQAVRLMDALRPKITIAMHFKTPRLSFPIANERAFVQKTGARSLKSDVMEITQQTLPALAGAWILDYPVT